MATSVHPTAILEPGALLGDGVEIGPYAFVGSEVRLGEGCVLHHHASVVGKTEAGIANEFFPFASIGQKSQDLKYRGEPTFLSIGSGNRFREFVTVNRATGAGGRTVIGSDNLFLAYAHVAHDCTVGSGCIFSNNATLAGHVRVGDYVTIGGLTAVHQHCRLGEHAMLGGCTKVVQDVPPFCLVDGNPARLRALNLIGLKRRGFSEEVLQGLRCAFRLLFEEGKNLSQGIEAVEASGKSTPEITTLLEFLRSSERGVTR
ncbi:acyl-ACP--UDP-N-acetylglucosamine O-acyltransferase [Methylacidimicrobium tartarophylax]|uniref:Acyl-[acyl-carrier-protein]--UDP-N-acetylglucosamine O-acyltransferase n=1 Tax=Methylacidimicrobium tartarophylax TaxID=1041768 RepID=A0A5E6MGU6_9BACT|nr:acyl-ACP--UDP-N-acetylglucosamine O-acyltransferase [Methylacidimicrobium tartarophylax]VVM04705.1 UDP-N-acetylglucosamine acyltransferase [Methylacidimicrobium tartarophylax]